MAAIRRVQPERAEDLFHAIDFAVTQKIEFVAEPVQLHPYLLLGTALVSLPVFLVLLQLGFLPVYQLDVLTFGGLVLL